MFTMGQLIGVDLVSVYILLLKNNVMNFYLLIFLRKKYVIFFNCLHSDETNLSPAVSLTAKPKSKSSSSSSQLKSSSGSKSTSSSSSQFKSSSGSKPHTLPVSNQHASAVSNQHASAVSQRHTLPPVSQRHTLTVSRVAALHLGDYACVANNTLGTNKATVTLTGNCFIVVMVVLFIIVAMIVMFIIMKLCCLLPGPCHILTYLLSQHRNIMSHIFSAMDPNL